MKELDHRGRLVANKCFGLTVLKHPDHLRYWSPNQYSFSSKDQGFPTPKCYTINEVGSRGGQIVWNAPKVLMLGCSNIFGHGVHDIETSSWLLQSKIGYQVVNAGVPGFGTFNCVQYTFWWLERIPNIKVVVFCKPHVGRHPVKLKGSEWELYPYDPLMWDEPKALPVPHDKLKALSVYHDYLKAASKAEESQVEKLSQVCEEQNIRLILTSYVLYKNIYPVDSFKVAKSAFVLWDDLIATTEGMEIRVSPGRDNHPSREYNEVFANLLSDMISDVEPDSRKVGIEESEFSRLAKVNVEESLVEKFFSCLWKPSFLKEDMSDEIYPMW